ncbi:MAG: transposase [archaeon]
MRPALPRLELWRRISTREYKTLETLLNNADLSFVERLVQSCFHEDGPGRPPRNPLGLFKAHLAKQFLKISSLRELEHHLRTDRRLRAICGIPREQPAYGRTVLSRFNQLLGPRRLKHLADRQVRELVQHHIMRTRTTTPHTTLKTYNRHNTHNRTNHTHPLQKHPKPTFHPQLTPTRNV